MRQSRHIVVYTTCPDVDSAKTIARTLLERRLAACVNMFSISSMYWWKGALEEGEEVGVLIKTTSDRYEDIERTLSEMHPYELPALLVLPVSGERRYLSWIEESVDEG